MKLLLAAAACPIFLFAGQCAPTDPIAPTGTLTATLDENNCHLADGSSYAEHPLVLATRGRIEMDLSSNEGGLTLSLRDSSGTLLAAGRGIRRAIERGRYNVVVAGESLGQAGDYTVQTSFTAELGTLCRDYPLVGLNRKVGGRLGGSGCTAPDGTAYDGYSMRTLGPGTLDIAVTATGFTPSIILRSDSGHAIATGEGALSFPVEGDRWLTIVVNGGGKVGAYQLTTSFQPADDPCRAQMTFTSSGRHAGSVTAQSCSFVADSLGNRAFYNFYDLKVTQPGLAQLTLSSTAFDPLISLRDGAGNLLASDRLGGGKGVSAVYIQLPPGNYTVLAVSGEPNGGNYVFNYTFLPGPADICPVLDLAPEASVSGTLSAASCRSPQGLADVYSVTLPASGTLALGMTSGDFDAALAIRDARDNLVVLDDSVTGLTDSRLSADLPAGNYTVVASGVTGSGGYNLTSRFTPHEIASCTDPQAMDPNTGYIQRIGAVSCTGPNGQPVDLYQFTLPAGGTVAAVMTATEIDGFLTLTDAGGGFLRSDDNTFGDGDPLFVQYLPAGTYRLSARGAQASLGGLYRVDVLYQEGSRPPGCTPSAKITPDSSTDGAIRYTGCQFTDDTFADVYQLDIAATTSISFKLTSAAFDAYLRLLDAKGNVIDEDDDSGGDTNALVLRTLDPGTYYVVSKPATDYASSGAYTLTVSTGN